ncbi:MULTISPECIES: hypothetical protein [Chitinophagaceae]
MEHRKRPYNPEEIPDISELENRGWDTMRQMLDEHMPQKEEHRVVPMYWRWLAAAVLLLMVGVAGFHFLTEKTNTEQPSWTGTTTKPLDADSLAPVIAHNKKDSGSTADNHLVASADNSAQMSTGKLHSHLPLADIDQFESGSLSGKNTDALASKSKMLTGVGQRTMLASGEIRNIGKTTGQAEQGSGMENLSDSKVMASGMPVTTATVAPRSNTSELETGQKKFNMDFSNKDLANNTEKQAITQTNPGNKENVEAASEFRKRMNQALWDEEKSDSAKQVVLAKTKKAQSDSQLIARRREQLEQYFGQKENKEKETASHTAKVDLAVSVNRNMTADKVNANNSSIYGLPVYPAVSASVKLSEKIGFTTGLGTAAPGNFTNASISGPVAMSSPAYSAYLNAAASGASASSGKTFITSNSSTVKDVTLSASSPMEVQQAYYWQIPLMFDYYVVHSQLKFSAGTDFSIIQRVLVGNAYSSQLMSSSTYNSSGGVYQVRNFDPRLSIGAQYRLNKFLLGARFSRSFQPALQYNGAPTNGGNNQVFNISVGYSFMK